MPRFPFPRDLETLARVSGRPYEAENYTFPVSMAGGAQPNAASRQAACLQHCLSQACIFRAWDLSI